jgi:hypothetical protein
MSVSLTVRPGETNSSPTMMSSKVARVGTVTAA